MNSLFLERDPSFLPTHRTGMTSSEEPQVNSQRVESTMETAELENMGRDGGQSVLTKCRPRVVHLVLLRFACSLFPFLRLLLLFGLGGFAPVPVGPAGGVSLLGPHRHAQAVVGRLAVFVRVGGPPDGERRLPTERGGAIKNNLMTHMLS